MVRKTILLLLAGLSLACTNAKAQFCQTYAEYEKIKQANPDAVAKYEAQMKKDIDNYVRAMKLRKFMKTTASISDTLTVIPVVVHVIHDYGTENVTDAQINKMLTNLNDFYNCKNDTSGVIPPFKKYVGDANFHFQLATKDPVGNPTRGITRRTSYLTYGGDDQAKFDQWDPGTYMNIWVEAFIGQGSEGGGIVAAYAVLPPSAAANPYSDGVMTNSMFITTVGNGDGATIPHEVGHYFNLSHTFGPYNFAGKANGVPCSDDDVDDTPPTHGNQFGCDVYDTTCAQGYFKVYPSTIPGVDSLVDYPDTVNVQNVMNYADCKIMFTKGQVARMRSTINSTVANRNALSTTLNWYKTGIYDTVNQKYIQQPDMYPVADFSVENGVSSSSRHTSTTHFFLAANKTFYFKNQTWNDTVTSLSWTFSNGATVPTSTSNIVTNAFTTPGWVSVSLTATGNHTGASTIKNDSAVYVADPTGTPALGYFEEFNPTGDIGKYPIFNYFKNDFKWEFVSNAGYYDNYSIRYDGYDYRSFPANYTGSPKVTASTFGGDFDDFFTPAFDVSSMGGSTANLNFMYTGAFRTGISFYMTDTLEIDYSINGGISWNVLKYLDKGNIAAVGSQMTPYTPTNMSQWKLQSITLPAAARTSATFFRFRYRPGTPDIYGYGSSNYFYIDRLNVNNQPLGVNTIMSDDRGVTVAPNPTSGSSYIMIKEPINTVAHIVVTDVAGKIVYTTQQQVSNGATRVEIPASYISVKGMYLVQVRTDDQTQTEKLIVY